MFCPKCGGQNVVAGDPSPNGGELYVAEELGFGTSTEYCDEANPFECNDCGTNFYVGEIIGDNG